jgi:hypothetical protein
MWKDVAIVAIAAGLGEFGARKYGTAIEAKAVEMKIPTSVAHAAVVGGFAAASFFVVKAVWK